MDLPLGLFWSVGLGLLVPGLGTPRFEWRFPLVQHLPDDGASVFEFTIGNFF